MTVLENAVTRMVFFFLDFDLYCLPPTDDVKPLLLDGMEPFFVPLCSASRDDVALNTRAKMLLELFVNAFEGVGRYPPESFALLVEF